jgi:hypothetical protein
MKNKYFVTNYLTIVIPLVLCRILDQSDICQRNLAHTVHKMQPPSLCPEAEFMNLEVSGHNLESSVWIS